MSKHREEYPEQYEHPLVGRRVTIEEEDGGTVTGTVERVVSSRFGKLAILEEHGPERAWPASTCKPVETEEDR